jgi:hypothetical protein
MLPKDGMLYLRKHQIGGLEDVVTPDHAHCAGEGDRLDFCALKAVLGLQITHRPDRGMRCRVTRVAPE